MDSEKRRTDQQAAQDQVEESPASGKVSIEKILEGMTKEFNSNVNVPKEKEERGRTAKEKRSNDSHQSQKVEESKQLKKEDEQEKTVAKESFSDASNQCNSQKEVEKDNGKKENNAQRIVLTFRTVNEKTDDGKKTKISSCSTNLVADELANCDKMSGVLVKIQNPEENSDSEEGKTESESSKRASKPNDAKSKANDSKTDKKDTESKQDDKEEDDTKQDNEEDSDEKPGAKRRRRKRAVSIEEAAPSLKRSARLCKDSFKNVLESAMARKEKSNETLPNRTTPRRKYNRPGRPKKIDNAKEKGKAADVSTDINSSADNSISSDTQTTANNTIATENESMEMSIDEIWHKILPNSPGEEMPNLSPIEKSPEAKKSLSVTVNSIDNNTSVGSMGSEDESNSEMEKFAKPLLGRGLRRERGRFKISQTARKIARSDISDVELSPVKRTRRSLAPSPSPAEGQASKPESTAISNEPYAKPICLCQMKSQLYVSVTTGQSPSQPLYCTAVDSIDKRLIGCCNEVDANDVAMRRPSTRIPYIILCRVHKERLLRHNCCPTCGLFCTQGKFLCCANGHQYHRECEIFQNKKGLCPHCASESVHYEILVTMNGCKKPVFIPTRRKILKLPTAKMSLPGKGDNTRLAELPPTQLAPLIPPEMINIPNPTINPERPERYTIMSLYTSVKNGDVEKLVNVLASGHNANHMYKEYGNRTALHIAADKGHLACVHVLVQQGAQVDVMDKNQLTPMMLAASKGELEVVRYFVRIGADVTLKGDDGMTALHVAAKSGCLGVCRIILTECKVHRTLIDCVDDGGWTSLIWACEFQRTDVARFLLEKKCDPLIRDSEQNIALHWSAYSGSSEITEMLLEEGCDVNAVNVHGDTPLHIAARQDQYAVTVLLLARGAKVNEVNAANKTALQCCTNDGDTMAALRLNAKVNELTEHMREKTVKILSNDISRGKEKNPIQCVNGFDVEDKPTDFLYVTENCFTSDIKVDRTITSLQSCHCEDNCTTEKCLCGNISLKCWYDEEGKLVPEFNYGDPPMLFECNQACDCNRLTCHNRVVQHGLTQRFQLFRTEGKGWGLRTLKFIPKGTYVCEYVGEIISDSEADQREDDSYLFDLDNRDGETYCIDARRYGNIARFINHSCAPNLLPVRVFVEHQDQHFPRIAFFANRDIQANEELGFDYGEKFWIIKCKSFTCTCGAFNCRYSERTIQSTLENYRKKIQQEEMMENGEI